MISKDEWTAMTLCGFVVSPALLIKLHRKGLLSASETFDILEHSILTIDTFKTAAGYDARVAAFARYILEQTMAHLQSAQPRQSA